MKQKRLTKKINQMVTQAYEESTFDFSGNTTPEIYLQNLIVDCENDLQFNREKFQRTETICALDERLRVLRAALREVKQLHYQSLLLERAYLLLEQYHKRGKSMISMHIYNSMR